MPTTVTPALTEVFTKDEYDLMVRLTARADALVKDRVVDYIRSTERGYGPKSGSDIVSIEYKPTDRAGRDEFGRYDIEVRYPDPYGDDYSATTTTTVPAALLWDPAGAIGATLEAIEAERARQAELDAAQKAVDARAREDYERREFKRLSAKYGKGPK